MSQLRDGPATAMRVQFLGCADGLARVGQKVPETVVLVYLDFAAARGVEDRLREVLQLDRKSLVLADAGVAEGADAAVAVAIFAGVDSR